MKRLVKFVDTVTYKITTKTGANNMKRLYLLVAMLFPVLSCFGAPSLTIPAIADGKIVDYTLLKTATKEWRVCALLPHGRDRFWWGVSWGLAEEAKRLGVKLGVYEAGGYENLEVQRRQFAHCRELQADAIILAAVTSTDLNQEVEDAIANHVVVIDLINGISTKKVTARAVGDTSELAAMAARYILQHTKTTLPTIVWFPGPHNAQWVTNAERGVRRVLIPSVANIVDGGYDVPEPTRQMNLIRGIFHQYQPDYVLGNSVAAVSAAKIVASDKKMRTKVVAWYANEPVVDMIAAGLIEAAPSNNPVLQARVAFDLAIRALEHKKHSFDVKVIPEMVDHKNVETFQSEKLFAPRGTWMIQRELPK